MFNFPAQYLIFMVSCIYTLTGKTISPANKIKQHDGIFNYNNNF